VAGASRTFLDFVKANNILAGATVLFNSPGGSLSEGMKLGETIRRAGFNTDIAVRGPAKDLSIATRFGSDVEDLMHAMGVDTAPPEKLAGSCLSACTLAYIGGVHRYFTRGSVFGVHRFFSTGNPGADDLDTAQIVSANIVEYIRHMGVDSRLFTRMVEASPDEMRVIGTDELVALNVVNGRVASDEWTLKTIPQGIYVVGELIDERGTSKMTFMCDRKTHNMASIIYIPEAGNPNGDVTLAQIVASQWVDAGYFVDDEIHKLKSARKRVTVIPIGRNPSEPSEVQVIWGVSPADIASITSAKKSTGFALLSSTPGVFFGLHLSLGARDREMIRNYAADCWR